MNVNPKKFQRNNRKLAEIKEIKEKIELESDLINLEFLKFDLKYAKRHAKLQRIINKRNSWRDYTC